MSEHKTDGLSFFDVLFFAGLFNFFIVCGTLKTMTSCLERMEAMAERQEARDSRREVKRQKD